MIRLLITARDAAAAFHMIEIARRAQADPRFAVRVVAQAPAAAYFREAGIAASALDLPAALLPDDPAALALRQAAATVLEETRPDAVLCGLSTPVDGGIDEAVLALAPVPSFVMQDFWGERNAFFGRAADLYLALDDEAVRLSRERHNLDAVVVGSPRHGHYRTIDIPALRTGVRRRFGIAGERPVIGFFGQALHFLPGYHRTVLAWADAVKRLGPVVALYRPHPREDATNRATTRRLLAEAGLEPVLVDSGPIEEALLACDTVCSAFSNCTYDAAYLNRHAAQPLLVPLALFFDPELIDYFVRMVRLSEFAYLKAGLVMLVDKEPQLVGSLNRAMHEPARRALWQAAQKLPDPGGASDRVLAIIAGRVADRARAAASGAPDG